MTNAQFYRKYANTHLGKRSEVMSSGITLYDVYKKIKQLDEQICLLENKQEKLLELAERAYE